MRVRIPDPNMTPTEIAAYNEGLLDAFDNGKHIYLRILCYNNINHGIYIFNEDEISMEGVTLSSILNPEEDYTFGSFVSSEVQIYFIKSDKTKYIDWSDSITVQFYYEENGTFEYVTVGDFYGTDPQIIKGKGTDILFYTGYDTASNPCFNNSANDLIQTFTFPCNSIDLFSNIDTYLYNNYNIHLYYTTAYLNFTIVSNPFKSDLQIKQVLSMLAEAHGMYIRTAFGIHSILLVKMDILPYNINYTLTPDCYYELNKPDIEIPAPPAIQFIDTTYPQNNESYPASYTGIPYKIVDNPIFNHMDSATKTSQLTTLWTTRLYYGNRSDNPRYFPMNVRAIGNILFETGDIINVEDLNGHVYPMRIFTHILKWNGGIESYYECTGNLQRQDISDYEKTVYQINETISDRIVDSLSFGTKGMALDASQGQILNNKFTPIEIGAAGTPFNTALNDWKTKVPADGMPHLVYVRTNEALYFGFLARYLSGGTSYGFGVLGKFSTVSYVCYLNNNNITKKTISAS